MWKNWTNLLSDTLNTSRFFFLDHLLPSGNNRMETTNHACDTRWCLTKLLPELIRSREKGFSASLCSSFNVGMLFYTSDKTATAAAFKAVAASCFSSQLGYCIFLLKKC